MKISLRILVAAASLAIAAPVYAQGGGGGGGGGGGQRMSPEERMAQQKALMFKDMTLSPTVSAKIDTIMMDATKKQTEMMTAARAGGGDMAAMGEARTKLTNERNMAIKALLADDMKKKFDENLAAMPQGRGRGGL